METWKHGDIHMETWRNRDIMVTWRHGHRFMETSNGNQKPRQFKSKFDFYKPLVHRTYFLKKVTFLQIWVFKGYDQL